jgi:hypothetical protein
MADLKISALTAASTPLAGTEVLPIVQSSATVKVATNDLTVRNIRANATTGILQVTGPASASTRVATVPDANFTVARTDAAQSFTGDQTLSTGNLVIGTSGKGIDFSATSGSGTSELLADYEEGTWTPVISDGTNNATMGANNSGLYTKVGRLVTISAQITVGTIDSVGADARITGLPFTNANVTAARAGIAFGYGSSLAITAGRVVTGYVEVNQAFIELQYWDAATGTTGLDGAEITNGGTFFISGSYTTTTI